MWHAKHVRGLWAHALWASKSLVWGLILNAPSTPWHCVQSFCLWQLVQLSRFWRAGWP